VGNIFNEDFRDFISILNDTDVEYVLVGGYAVILHGYRRTTGDLDIWVNTTKENYLRLRNAFLIFGLPTKDLSEQNFLDNDAIEVFTYGIEPVSIDVMKKVKGLNFEEVFSSSQIFMDGDLPVRFIGYQQLVNAKKAAGRFKDLDDLEKLSL
jgi:hypothetical protein